MASGLAWTGDPSKHYPVDKRYVTWGFTLDDTAKHVEVRLTARKGKKEYFSWMSRAENTTASVEETMKVLYKSYALLERDDMLPWIHGRRMKRARIVTVLRAICLFAGVIGLLGLNFTFVIDNPQITNWIALGTFWAAITWMNLTSFQKAFVRDPDKGLVFRWKP